MADKIAPASLRNLQLRLGILASLDTCNIIGLALRLARHVSLDIIRGLDDIAADIEGVTLYTS